MLGELCVDQPLSEQERQPGHPLPSPPPPCPSLAGDQSSFIIGAATAASLQTSFEFRAALHKLGPASHTHTYTLLVPLFKGPRGRVTHLYLQLLNHLHLDSALSGAAVIEGVLVVQVPKGERTQERSLHIRLS